MNPSPCLFPKTIEKQRRSGESHLHFRYFFPQISLLFLFMFLSSSYFLDLQIYKNYSKKSLILFNLVFLCIFICCANNPSWLGKLLVNCFPIPSFLLHLLVTFKQAHRKTQPNSSQASHKKHIFSCTFGNFLNQSYPVSPNKERDANRRGNCRGREG